MADNSINNMPSQAVEENSNQNNICDNEADKDKIVSTPPTQNTAQIRNPEEKDIQKECKSEACEQKLNREMEAESCETEPEKRDSNTPVTGEDMVVDSESIDTTTGNETSTDNDVCDINEDASLSSLKVELPSKDLKSDGIEETDKDHAEGEGACGNSGADKSGDADESIHQVKWVYFNKKQVPIITQNENGPCPLLALINVLLLQNRVTLPPQTEIISASQLMHHLGDSVLQNVPGEDGVSTPSRLNFEQNMGDAMAVMYKLQTGLDVNVRFTGVRDFEYTSECIIFDLLQIPLYHGWLVDPQNSTEVEALGKCSYNQLVEKIIVQKTSDQPDLVSQALVAEEFLENSASQLTYHGLSELCTQLKEEELAVLFRNNHFTTLYRHKGELFQLVTDQGFLNESNVVWETLSNVEGDCHFVDSEFRTYTKPEPPPLSREPSTVPVNSEEQIDQDYLVALSLQQEQQPADQMAWTPQNSHMSDEELAKHLQEEERRAAMAEANEDQRRQGGQQPPRQQSQQPPSQRRPVRSTGQPKEDKKDCCIL